jgi:hypothetical protein
MICGENVRERGRFGRSNRGVVNCSSFSDEGSEFLGVYPNVGSVLNSPNKQHNIHTIHPSLFYYDY